MAREPVPGVAYFPHDSVVVVSGPDSGSRGAVVSLVSMEPEPHYGVRLADGVESPLPQSALLTATAEDPGAALGELQRWYSSRCDGEWEHRLGVRIETLDNPGWLVKIDLQGTPWAALPFSPMHEIDDEREWIACKVEDGQFQGAGGPHMLGAILEVFRRWVRDASQRAD